ncbi:MAG: stage III sporulation protein AF [Lachnospiraceae bacterium]|nr:stage III sporulation protein AF [Lachnospiraceae bacterium]
MHSEFFNTICRVGIFMICAQTIVHFRPNGSYEKYIKLLVSVMLLIQILKPVMDIFGESSSEDFEVRIAWFDEQLQEGLYKAEEGAESAEEIINQMTLDEAYEKITEDGGTENMDEGIYIEPVEKVEDVKLE